MELHKLDDMFKGWFVGDFTPNVAPSVNTEVGIKRYKKGDYEPTHYHKISKEITVILNGSVEMNGKQYNDGDIIEIFPNEATDFRALTDVMTVVVKLPSSKDDKFMGVPNND